MAAPAVGQVGGGRAESSGMADRQTVEVRRSSVPLCECEQGEWGERCPACGLALPPRPGPLRSQHAERAVDAVASAQARASLHHSHSFRGWHL